MNPTLPDPAHGLAQEQQAARSMLELLQREQVELTAARIDGLAELSPEKNALALRMTTLANARYAALAAVSDSADEDGMRAWLDQGRHDNARQLWTDLLALAKSAKELNRTNGLLIARHMARNQAALNVLRGTAAGGNFYGPDGQTTVQGSGHRLVVG